MQVCLVLSIDGFFMLKPYVMFHMKLFFERLVAATSVQQVFISTRYMSYAGDGSVSEHLAPEALVERRPLEQSVMPVYIGRMEPTDYFLNVR